MTIDGWSGSWILVSASGKPIGAPVEAGDQVYLANFAKAGPSANPDLIEGEFGGFLETNNMGCFGNYLCTDTSAQASRDGLSGTWQIFLDGGSGQIHEGDGVRIRNSYNFNGSGHGGYLDTRGEGCADDLYCVSTAQEAIRDGSSTTWRFENFYTSFNR